jgi:hypothetical protein
MLPVKYTQALVFAKSYPISIITELVLDVRNISIAFRYSLRLYPTVYSDILKLKHRQLGLPRNVSASSVYKGEISALKKTAVWDLCTELHDVTRYGENIFRVIEVRSSDVINV